MDEITGLRHYWNHDYIRPGGTGSVGDVLVNTRLKSSAPYLPLRFDPAFSKRQTENGSEITSQPYVSSSFWKRRGFRINHGWYYQDKRAPAKSVEPIMGSTMDYSWRNKIATVVEAKRTGNRFLPLPDGYKLPNGAIPRGGSFPTVTAEIGVPGAESDSLVTAAESNLPSVVSRPQNSLWDIPVVKNV